MKLELIPRNLSSLPPKTSIKSSNWTDKFYITSDFQNSFSKTMLFLNSTESLSNWIWNKKKSNYVLIKFKMKHFKKKEFFPIKFQMLSLRIVFSWLFLVSVGELDNLKVCVADWAFRMLEFWWIYKFIKRGRGSKRGVGMSEIRSRFRIF